EVRLILPLGEDRAHLARMRERPHQQVRFPAPGRLLELEPVPLDLLARRVLDLDRGPPLDPGAGLAARPEAAPADLADEGDVAARVAQRCDLVVERRAPQVRVLDQPLAHVRLEAGEVNGDRAAAHPRYPLPAQVGADRLPVTPEVTGDR